MLEMLGVLEMLKITKAFVCWTKTDEDKFCNLFPSCINDSTIPSLICYQLVGENHKTNSSSTWVWNETSGGEIPQEEEKASGLPAFHR